MPGAQIEREYSAGGVVVREAEGGPECIVIVPTRRAASGSRVLALPKGHPDQGETRRQAALREVREETGVEGRIESDLGDVRYWYQRDGRKIAKVVTFYLVAYVEGDPEAHSDHEVERASWMPMTEAAKKLTYKGDRDMVVLALSHMKGGR
jgi:8-oxo-dGTP pyrophosphatase MutT (NUDIX family)